MIDALGHDPCDGWPWAWPLTGYRWLADRAQPASVEAFEPRGAPPVFQPFLLEVRTDLHHWGNELDWTLESGPPEAPSSLDIGIPYTYRGGGSDYFAGGCWNPGDPPELETGQPYFVEGKARCEVSLLPAEQELIEKHIWNNPPEESYRDD